MFPSLSGAELALRAARTDTPARVAIVCDDFALASVLRRQVMLRPDFVETSPDNAAVIVTDHHPIWNPRGAAVLVVGSDERPERGENGISSLDPALILSAALLVASGHRIEPSSPMRTDTPSGRLSVREQQVIELLVQGASNKAIARALDISVHTAKFHVAAVLDKLGARNRADAVAIALREGLVAA
jgi:DNA-binding CsgD family transcriptional regulator